VHQTRKNAAGAVAAGQGLRGSSDILAFGDSSLYLRRTQEHLVLSSEHRAAPASAPVHLELVATDAKTTHLEVIAELQDGNGKRRSLEERVRALLAQGVVLTRAKLRDSRPSRTSAWAMRWSRLSEPAGFAARPLAGDV